MKSSCIAHPANEQLLIIRKWQVLFCEGHHCAAALMSFFEYWHNWKVNTDLKNKKLNDIAEQHGDTRSHDEAVYQFHSLQEITEGILDLFARNTVIKAVQYLESKGVISAHANPNPRYGFDKTKYYQFHPSVCTEWLSKNYLIDNKISSTFKNKPRSSEIKLSTFKNKLSSFEKGRSITKINYKDKKQSINAGALFISNEESLLNEQSDESIKAIVAALTAKGLSPDRFNYLDVINEIQQLQKNGATLNLFEEAYDISANATKGRSFGMRYLIKVVKGLLVKTKQPLTSNITQDSQLGLNVTSKRLYQNELSNGSHWINQDE